MCNLKKLTLALAALALCSNAQAIELINDGDTTVNLGGFVKAEGLFTSADDDVPENNVSDFEGDVRESRINLEAKTVVDDRNLKAFIETDFYGGDIANDQAELRLRHAFIQVDDVTFGKTWNGQFFAVAPLLTEQLDFWGVAVGTVAGSGLNVRPDLTVHYAKNGFRVTAQEPVNDDADLPDLVASYTANTSDFGYANAPDLDFIVGVMGRDVNKSVEDDSDSKIGIGGSLATRLNLAENRWGKGSLHASVYTGDGMGVYSGLCASGPLNPAVEQGCDAEDGDLVSQTGFSVGYRQVFSPKLRANLRYGEVNVDNEDDTTLDVKSVNLIYTYLPGLDFGVEWRDRSRTTLPWRLGGQEVEVMARYKF